MKRLALLTVALLLAAPLAAAAKASRIAVFPFQVQAGKPGMRQDVASAMQDVFVTELVQGGKFGAIEANLTLSGDVDPSTAKRLGQRFGADALLTGSVTPDGGRRQRREPGGAAGPESVTVHARLIDTSTGEILWADEAQVSVGGFGGGVDDERLRQAVTPAVRKLVASLGAADL